MRNILIPRPYLLYSKVSLGLKPYWALGLIKYLIWTLLRTEGINSTQHKKCASKVSAN